MPDMNLQTQLSLPTFSSPEAALLLVSTTDRNLSVGLRDLQFSVKSDWLKIQDENSAHAQKIGSGYKTWFLVLIKWRAASGHGKTFRSVSDEDKKVKRNRSFWCISELNQQFARSANWQSVLEQSPNMLTEGTHTTPKSFMCLMLIGRNL